MSLKSEWITKKKGPRSYEIDIKKILKKQTIITILIAQVYHLCSIENHNSAIRENDNIPRSYFKVLTIKYDLQRNLNHNLQEMLHNFQLLENTHKPEQTMDKSVLSHRASFLKK